MKDIILNINDITADTILIDNVFASAYKIPTETPESDGTIQWDSTTLVLVEIYAGDTIGTGYTYSDSTAATVINSTLKQIVENENCLNIPLLSKKLFSSIRNQGQCGIAAMAVSAVDNALWDLKAKLFNVPLCNLLGKSNERMLLYGSGGFTSYSDAQTQKQFEHWASQGITHFKMKVGREPGKDVHRVKAARKAIGERAKLFVDANGAYTIKEAIEKAKEFSEYNVSWFEEPVTSDNLSGLHFIKEHVPAMVNVAAGEYGYNLSYFQTMLNTDSVDILQADATRCGGITNFLKAENLCEARYIPFSSHCAPSLHLHAAVASPSFYISEYFFDHERIESMLFDGVGQPEDGYLYPDMSRPGFGIEFKHKDAAKYKLSS
jgi:L-alanine-DL-glutamate epimerase-like enolase superfamily enzyme